MYGLNIQFLLLYNNSISLIRYLSWVILGLEAKPIRPIIDLRSNPESDLTDAEYGKQKSLLKKIKTKQINEVSKFLTTSSPANPKLNNNLFNGYNQRSRLLRYPFNFSLSFLGFKVSLILLQDLFFSLGIVWNFFCSFCFAEEKRTEAFFKK